MAHYIALIHKDEGSDYGVSFPDLPGCVTAGKTLDEARAFAEEALALHLGGLAEDGEAVPEPSSLEAVMANRENRDGVAALVSVRLTAPRILRVNITMPEDVLARVDAYAESQGMNRSGFLAYAAKREMDEARGFTPVERAALTAPIDTAEAAMRDIRRAHERARASS